MAHVGSLDVQRLLSHFNKNKQHRNHGGSKTITLITCSLLQHSLVQLEVKMMVDAITQILIQKTFLDLRSEDKLSGGVLNQATKTLYMKIRDEDNVAKAW